jgi:hypothetical protein
VCRQAREEGRPEDVAALLRQALALWRGDPLSDLGDRPPDFRRRMAAFRRDAAEALAEERGLEPSAEPAAAHKRVLTGQPVAVVNEELAVRRLHRGAGRAGRSATTSQPLNSTTDRPRIR